MSDEQRTITPDEMRAVHAQVMVAGRILLGIDPVALDALLLEYSRMDALMPFVDPTAYHDTYMRTIPQHRTVTQAVATARKKIAAEIPPELLEGL